MFAFVIRAMTMRTRKCRPVYKNFRPRRTNTPDVTVSRPTSARVPVGGKRRRTFVPRIVWLFVVSVNMKYCSSCDTTRSSFFCGNSGVCCFSSVGCLPRANGVFGCVGGRVQSTLAASDGFTASFGAGGLETSSTSAASSGTVVFVDERVSVAKAGK